MPVAETLELTASLTEMEVPVCALVANRRSPSDAGALLRSRRDIEDAQIQRVHEALPAFPVAQLPLVPGEIVGSDALEEFARILP